MSPRQLAWKSSTDRRRKRAHVPLRAAQYYLDAVRERVSARGIALLCQNDVIARSGDGADAILAALKGAGDQVLDIFLHAIQVGGKTMLLGTLDRRVDRVRVVEADLNRIFA
jgi:hypothetical protein